MRRIALQIVAGGPLTAALLCLAAGAPARAAEHLDCMAAGYSEAESATIEAFMAGFDFREPNAPAPAYQSVLTLRADACAAEHGWSPEAKAVALRHRRASFLRTALRRNAPVAPDDVDRMDAAIAAADQAQLWQTIARWLEQTGRGEQRSFGTLDLRTLLPIFEAAGLEPGYDGGRFLGSWLIASRLERDLSAQFATL